MNQPGIAALCAGTGYILEVGLEQVMAWEQALVKRLYEGLRAIKGVTVYGDRQPEGTAVSFNLEGLSPADVGYILAGSYKIQVRTGLHCAPLLHECLGTQGQGTVRASISYLSKEEDVEALLGAVRELMGETR
jgi:selenocysteine lyase/cysteine desulfurase